MPKSKIVPVKYVFLDVVAYTKQTIEAQCYIIETLNRIVKGAVNRYCISDDSVIYIPTGDGMCIALLGADLSYDIHVTIAKEILRRIWVNNSRARLAWKKFEVRVGINQCDDNIIKDINGMENVAGAGINNARRIMDLADGSQILVSNVVYESLHPRKAYNRAFSPEFRKEVKHGLFLRMHQLVETDTNGLNVNPPSSLVSSPQPEPKLTRLAAYYFAHAIKNETFILSKIREDSFNHNFFRLLLWFLAKDSEGEAKKSPYDITNYGAMPDTGSDTFEGQFEWFHVNVPWSIAIEASYELAEKVIDWPMRSDCFESGIPYLIVNSHGKEKLKNEHPDIWNEFKLGELTS